MRADQLLLACAGIYLWNTGHLRVTDPRMCSGFQQPQSQHSRPTKNIRRYDGPIFLPPQIYKLLSEDAMKALKSYNTEAITRFHQRKVHNTEIVETPQDDPPGPPVPENDPPDLPESDLDIPSSTLLTVSGTALRIWPRLFRLTRHTRYHALRIPP